MVLNCEWVAFLITTCMLHEVYALQVQREIQEMIEAHQQLPGSIITALRARWQATKQQ